DRQVGNIMVVHDVEVDPVGACVDDIADFLSQAGKIGGKQAGCYAGIWVGHGNEYEKKDMAAKMSVLQFRCRPIMSHALRPFRMSFAAVAAAVLASCASVDTGEAPGGAFRDRHHPAAVARSAPGSHA